MTEPSSRPASQPEPSPRSEGAGTRSQGGIAHEMRTLSDVIRNLEEQLDRMISANDALKKDLEEERARRLTLEDRMVELRQRLRRSEEDAAARENQSAELQQANQERSRLTTQLREARQALDQERRARQTQESLVERLRGSRADAMEELSSVEAQFERGMQMVADAQAQLTIAREEREALAGRLKVTEERLRQTEAERDYLVGEVEQSRAALDDIRRSLADACVVPGQAGPDEEPA